MFVPAPAILRRVSAEPEPSHSWVRVGAAYAAVVGGTIRALVYHAGVQRGGQGGPEGEQADAGPGWYLVWIDEPHRHYQLSTPLPPADAPTEELDKSVLIALAEAGDVIDTKLGGGPTGPNGRQ